MEFKEGDVISGRGIDLARYVGHEVINEDKYIKVLEFGKSATHYIPMNKADDLRKLPSKADVKKLLKMFDKESLIDDGEIEGSRYKYFKEKLEQVDFKKTLEVLHDLSALRVAKEINSSERKLLNVIREKILTEIAFILECSSEDLENVIDLEKVA